MEYDNEKITIKMIKKSIDFDNKIVLEIGCGEGKTSSLLADDAQQYIGIDPDSQAINKAILNYKNVDFQIGSGEKLNFQSAYFDIVLFTLSLHHHQDSCKALNEAFRVLTDKGRLLIVEPAIDGELEQFFHLFNDETIEIKTALKNIMQSRFLLEYQDTFNTKARFKNKEDLCRYDFGRDQTKRGDENLIIEKLNQLQPDSKDHEAIVLNDTINMYSLIKR